MVEKIADEGDHFEIFFFVVAADIVTLAIAALCEYLDYRLAMIPDKQPVPHIFTVAVDRQGLVVQGVVEHQRNQFLRKLVGAVVIGTVGDAHRQPIGVEIGAGQVIRGGLGGGIRRTRIVGRGLGKPAGFAKRTVHFIGAHMEKARPAHPGIRRKPAVFGHFEQGKRSFDIGSDKCSGAGDRTIDMGFRGKVDDGIDQFFPEQLRHQVTIADIPADKAIPLPFFYPRKVLQVAGIGQFIKIDHPPVRMIAVQQPDKIGADEPASSGHQHSTFIFHSYQFCVCIIGKRTYSTHFFS
ncbi:MAG: hypothetical protein ACD_75C02377G0001, partial [uncultured bacterium]